MKIKRILFMLAVAAAFAPFLRAEDAPLKKITIAYVATTCDSPVHIAKYNGYFAEEGLLVDLVQGDWAFIKEGLALGRIAATQGLVMNYLKPIEQGLDAKFTAGVHRGCLHLLTQKDSAIKTAADFKGKRIGVPAIGSSPWVFAVRAVGDAGLDYRKDVEWKPYPAAELKLALEKGQVDGVALADPIAEILLREGKVKSVVDQGKDKPYSDEYCCVVVVNGKLTKSDSKTAAALTRAILRASKWIAAHPDETAKLLVDKKIISGSVDVNAAVLKQLNYIPSVSGGKLATETAATSLKKIGILDGGVNVDKLVDHTFVQLDGLDDAWVESVNVGK